MGALKPWHIIVLVIVILLVFGSRKLPDMARGLGRSMRILKSETEAMKAESNKPDTETDAHAEPKHSREPLEPPTPVNETVIDGESVDHKKTH
ncbi:Sec-independent protein translocase subunit TatA [Glycomyces sp. NRRL B-16210]|uniref:Sec-independent protein translocase subunit TatA n=1 Tax=Glycomyces sp. NRRL B-16210 TaxID=1463821 RepID=UPI0005531801|nr:Sec-independent protein translocase subunit TatA [Glycomyces sp. NRRL B-16210]